MPPPHQHLTWDRTSRTTIDSSFHFDDPFNYFRRLESYSSSRPRSFSRPSTRVGERTPTSSPIKDLRYLDSPQRSGQRSVERSAQRSEITASPTHSYPRGRGLQAQQSDLSATPTHPPRGRWQREQSDLNSSPATPTRGTPIRQRDRSHPPPVLFPPIPPQTELASKLSHARTDSALDSYLGTATESDAFHELDDGFYTTHARTHEEEDSVGLTSTAYRDEEKSVSWWERGSDRRQHDPGGSSRGGGRGGRKKRGCCSRRIKWLAAFSIAFIVANAIIAGVVTHLRSNSFSYTPSNAHVTNATAFESGGATRANPNNTADGIGKGLDRYIYYQGGPQNFPSSSEWVSFDDMWTANLPSIQKSCSVLGYGDDNTDEENQDIYDSIQNRANASLVDHRFILAVVMQESHGCVHIPPSTSQSGVKNPGLMQSHNGHSFSSSHASLSILAMIQDGVQGVEGEDGGHGLVQNLNIYGDPYSAARGYNSGYIAASGDLSDGAGATACYVSDVANRLTGWVDAKSTCPGDDDAG